MPNDVMGMLRKIQATLEDIQRCGLNTVDSEVSTLGDLSFDVDDPEPESEDPEVRMQWFRRRCDRYSNSAAQHARVAQRCLAEMKVLQQELEARSTEVLSIRDELVKKAESVNSRAIEIDAFANRLKKVLEDALATLSGR